MTSAPMRVGMIGLGAIGQGVLTQLAAMPDAAVDIVGVLVRDPSRPRLAGTPPVVGTVEALLALEPEVVVEVAGHEALAQHGPAVLRSGRDLIAVSVGALARPEVYDSLVAAACEGGAQITVASGAIGGLDAISAAAVGGITRVTHTTRKPATTLLGAEGAALTEPRELFRGTAREGVLEFPESVNVAAAVSLAGVGLDRTELVVVADPAITRNRHEVVVEGDFGSLRFEIENVPTTANPKTGRIVAMSIVRTLLRRCAPLAIG
ncbi:MAG: aspartate dehydrogenase [Sphaerobacter thermophilus]|uniref:aspartate dehydrogenase n=1 Tax=Sphaerobacter thermophilus TaxID=2057 RepID=UPI000DB10037|nr:MAG: transcriptional regulator [Sphaerobacter thermophilus]